MADVDAIRPALQRAPLFDLLLQNSPACLAILDCTLRYTAASNKWLEFFHVADEDSLINNNHFELFPYTMELWENLFLQALRGVQMATCEGRIERPDGSVDWVRCEVNPWLGSNHTIQGVTVAIQTANEKKWTEEALEQALKAVETGRKQSNEFLQNASEEVRMPVNSITSLAEIILGEHRTTTIHRQARTILKESDLLLSKITDLLDHVRIDADDLSLDVQPFDLRMWQDDLIKSLVRPAMEKKIELSSEFQSDMYRFRFGDAERLRQICQNILRQALSSMESGAIKFAVQAPEMRERPDQIVFHFELSAESKFTNGYAPFKELCGEPGDNLRLNTSLTRRLLELMSSWIEMPNSSEGSQVVNICLPLKPCRDLSLLAMKSTVIMDYRRMLTGHGTAGCQVLVAETYPANRKVIHHHLRRAGHRADLVSTAEQAIEACQIREFALILLDIKLPGLKIHEIVNEIRSTGLPQNRGTPVIALIPSDDNHFSKTCGEWGICDVITKPIRQLAFMQTVEEWLHPETDTEREVTVDISHENLAGLERDPMDFELAIREAQSEEAVEQEIRRFIRAAEEVLPILSNAQAAGDMEAISEKSSVIAEAASGLTAMGVSEAARSLCTHSSNNDSARSSEALSVLIHEFQRLKNYIYRRSGS